MLKKYLSIFVLLSLFGCALTGDEGVTIYDKQGTIALYKYKASKALAISEDQIKIQELDTPMLRGNREYLAIVKNKPYHCQLHIAHGVLGTSITDARCHAAELVH